MRAVVLDTSALVRLYVPDGPLPDGLEAALEEASRSEVLLLAPELALAEVAQVIRKKEQRGELRAPDADEILAAVQELPLELVGHAALVERAVSIARAQRLTVYDALFFALALERRAELVTADDRLRKAFRRAQA